MPEGSSRTPGRPGRELFVEGPRGIMEYNLSRGKRVGTHVSAPRQWGTVVIPEYSSRNILKCLRAFSHEHTPGFYLKKKKKKNCNKRNKPT